MHLVARYASWFILRLIVPLKLMFGGIFRTSKSESSAIRSGWSLKHPEDTQDPRSLVDKLRKYRDLAEVSAGCFCNQYV